MSDPRQNETCAIATDDEQEEEIKPYQGLECKQTIVWEIRRDEGAFKVAELPTAQIVDIRLHNDVTVLGAQALVGVLKHTQVVHLTVRESCSLAVQINPGASCNMTGPINPGVLQQILSGEILRTITVLTLSIPLVDIVSHGIGTSLQGNTSMKELQLFLEPGMTEYGAQQLASGLQQSKIEWLLLLDLDTLGRLSQISPTETTTRNVVRAFFQQAVIASLRKLVIDIHLKDDDATTLGEALAGNSSIGTLILKWSSADVSAKGALNLARGISLSHITNLELDHRLESHTRSVHVPEILYEHGVYRSNSIRHLCIKVPVHGIPALELCLPQLQTLKISTSEVDDPTALTYALRCATNLCDLQLETYLDPQNAMLLSASLPFLVSLTDLTNSIGLTCEEGELLHVELDHEIAVQYSQVALRNIQPLAAEQFMMAVANHRGLVKLHFGSSLDVGYLGMEMIGLQLANLKARELVLYGVHDAFHDLETKDQGVNEARKKASQALVAGVRSNFYLQVLAVGICGFGFGCFIPPEMNEEMNFFLELNRLGRYILLSDDGVPPGAWCHILGKCGDNVGALYYFLREQPDLFRLASISG